MFEFDPAKSAGNREKHGIDFVEAQRLWLDWNRVEIATLTLDEPRTIVTGCIDGLHWTAIVTHRGGRVRIISVRRARETEVRRYGEQGD